MYRWHNEWQDRENSFGGVETGYCNWSCRLPLRLGVFMEGRGEHEPWHGWLETLTEILTFENLLQGMIKPIYQLSTCAIIRISENFSQTLVLKISICKIPMQYWSLLKRNIEWSRYDKALFHRG